MPLSFCFLFRPSSSSSFSSGYSNVLFLLRGFLLPFSRLSLSFFFRGSRLLLIITHEALKAQHRHGSSRICWRWTRWCSPVIQVETVDVVRQILDLLSHSVCSTRPSRADRPSFTGRSFVIFQFTGTRGAQDRFWINSPLTYLPGTRVYKISRIGNKFPFSFQETKQRVTGLNNFVLIRVGSECETASALEWMPLEELGTCASSYGQRTKSTAWLQVKRLECKILAHAHAVAVLAEGGQKRCRPLAVQKRAKEGRRGRSLLFPSSKWIYETGRRKEGLAKNDWDNRWFTTNNTSFFIFFLLFKKMRMQGRWLHSNYSSWK